MEEARETLASSWRAVQVIFTAGALRATTWPSRDLLGAT